MTDQTALDALLESIAETAKVRPAKRPAFKDAVFFVLCFAEWSSTAGAGAYTPRDRKALRAIAKASRALASAMKQRTRRVEKALLYEWRTRQQEGDKSISPSASRDDFSKCLDVPQDLADLAGHAQGRKIDRRRRNKRGAPAGFRNPVAFELVTGLSKAAKENGGKLSIDKTVGDGSLLAAVELCKPLLSETFRVPSAMTLDRMIRKSPAAKSRSVRSKKRKTTAEKTNS